MESKSLIAEEIKRIISEKRIEQSVIAAKAGYEETEFNDILTGQRQICDTDIPKIAYALGVSPNRIFGLPRNQEGV